MPLKNSIVVLCVSRT